MSNIKLTVSENYYMTMDFDSRVEAGEDIVISFDIPADLGYRIRLDFQNGKEKAFEYITGMDTFTLQYPYNKRGFLSLQIIFDTISNGKQKTNKLYLHVASSIFGDAHPNVILEELERLAFVEVIVDDENELVFYSLSGDEVGRVDIKKGLGIDGILARLYNVEMTMTTQGLEINNLQDALDELIKDVYTKEEIDNKFQEITFETVWKDPVQTKADLVITYPNPESGWTALVLDEGIIYRYSEEEEGEPIDKWIQISSGGVIPIVTDEVDGIVTSDMYKHWQADADKGDTEFPKIPKYATTTSNGNNLLIYFRNASSGTNLFNVSIPTATATASGKMTPELYSLLQTAIQPATLITEMAQQLPELIEPYVEQIQEQISEVYNYVTSLYGAINEQLAILEQKTELYEYSNQIAFYTDSIRPISFVTESNVLYLQLNPGTYTINTGKQIYTQTITRLQQIPFQTNKFLLCDPAYLGATSGDAFKFADEPELPEVGENLNWLCLGNTFNQNGQYESIWLNDYGRYENTPAQLYNQVFATVLSTPQNANISSNGSIVNFPGGTYTFIDTQSNRVLRLSASAGTFAYSHGDVIYYNRTTTLFGATDAGALPTNCLIVGTMNTINPGTSERRVFINGIGVLPEPSA